MNNLISQVRLTIYLEGRLGAKASNANTKKERKLANVLTKKGKKFYNPYNEPTYTECNISTLLSEECIRYFLTEYKPTGISPSQWNRFKQLEKLQYIFQQRADDISQCSNTKFTYEFIQ